ncbi:MAG: Rab family GTPase, partial [Candidatus Thorarchaeota archaeon]
MSSKFHRGTIFKSVLIGDGAVGKTSIRRRYLGDEFIEGHLATIGVDFAQKWVSYEGATVRFVCWDLSGQPSFKQVRKHYYQGSDGIILVYSVTDRESFDNASKWLVEAYKNMEKLPPTVIVANKIDLRPTTPEGQLVSTEEGNEFVEYFIDKLGVPAIFRETSAKTGENIEDTFQELLRMMSEVEV